jgi:hypothetical protein
MRSRPLPGDQLVHGEGLVDEQDEAGRLRTGHLDAVGQPLSHHLVTVGDLLRLDSEALQAHRTCRVVLCSRCRRPHCLTGQQALDVAGQPIEMRLERRTGGVEPVRLGHVIGEVLRQLGVVHLVSIRLRCRRRLAWTVRPVPRWPSLWDRRHPPRRRELEQGMAVSMLAGRLWSCRSWLC